MSETQIISLGNKLKPCPFCGRKMIFYKHTYINKHNHKVTEQYYMHEDYDIHQEKSCILDDINQPFVIGAGDIVRYEKHNKIKGNTKKDTFVATSVEMNGEGHIKYGDACGSRKIKFCRPIDSGCLQAVHNYQADEYLRKIAK